MGLLMEQAPGQIKAQPRGHVHRLLGRHLRDQERRQFLHVRGSRRILGQAQGVIGRELPGFAVGTPPIAAPDGQPTEA